MLIAPILTLIYILLFVCFFSGTSSDGVGLVTDYFFFCSFRVVFFFVRMFMLSNACVRALPVLPVFYFNLQFYKLFQNTNNKHT